VRTGERRVLRRKAVCMKSGGDGCLVTVERVGQKAGGGKLAVAVWEVVVVQVCSSQGGRIVVIGTVGRSLQSSRYRERD